MPNSHSSPAKVWIVELERREAYSHLIAHWHLESPAAGLAVSGEGSVSVNAWALSLNPDVQNRLHLVVRLSGRTLSIPPSIMRPDVISHVFKAPPEGHPQVLCGFHHSVSDAFDALAGFEVGFEIDGLIHPTARISIQ